MKISSVTSHVLRYELDEELGYSQQYYRHRSAHPSDDLQGRGPNPKDA